MDILKSCGWPRVEFYGKLDQKCEKEVVGVSLRLFVESLVFVEQYFVYKFSPLLFIVHRELNRFRPFLLA